MAEKQVCSEGILLPAGTTHVWDLPAETGQTVTIAGTAGARVSFLSRAGYMLSDTEMLPGGSPLPVPANAAMLAVMCLGNVPLNAAGAAPNIVPGFGAVTFSAGNRNAVVGWQTGNLVAQVGSTTLLGRGCALILPQPALTNKGRQTAAQAMVRLSETLMDQPGVETWLPAGVTVIALVLDIADPTANEEGDLALAVQGAKLSCQPIRVTGGNRKMLFYDVVSRDPKATHISVSSASRQGLRVAGIAGLSGRAQEWGIRLNGRVPEHFVAEGPLTPDGEIGVRIARGQSTGGNQ